VPELRIRTAPRSIQTHGTIYTLTDTATKVRFVACMPNPKPTPDRLPKNPTGAPWGRVYGELLTFDDPETRLPAIDRLEGFHPLSACAHAQAGGDPCLFRRVLIAVRLNGSVIPAWLYVGEDPISGSLKPLNKPIWTR
jgi:hypothetical protein